VSSPPAARSSGRETIAGQARRGAARFGAPGEQRQGGRADCEPVPARVIAVVVPDRRAGLRTASGQPGLHRSWIASTRVRRLVALTQDLCEVRAVSYGAVCAAVDRLAGRNVQVVSLHPRRLEDIWGDVRVVAAALGRRAAGEALLAGLLVRLDAVEQQAAVGDRPRVVSLEWLDPVMLGGTWMPELIAIAGGDPLGWRPESRHPRSTWPPCGPWSQMWW
jgi:hypothetical protein